jgi:uncharacterized protein YkwD
MVIRSLFLRLALISVAALLPATLISAPAVSAPSPSTQYANQAFEATNANRANQRLVALQGSACLQQFANAQAQRMATQRRMFHQSLRPILDQCRLSSVGENVAYGYSSGAATVKAWMGSTGHRANILNRNYRQMAIGAYQSSDNRWYVAQVFGRAR